VVEERDIVSIGYCIGRKWWHQGITSEAFEAVIRFMFDEVGVNRLEARHNVFNPNSGGVMKKCGLTYEGTLRQAATDNTGLMDLSVYSILRSEYEAMG
ncbi:MAG: GNAT family N-acetyltransferase, partial [Firmicutes bacterium]|nr:GNAT family N-acetyltransferase [Bacillota bacterium]